MSILVISAVAQTANQRRTIAYELNKTPGLTVYTNGEDDLMLVMKSSQFKTYKDVQHYFNVLGKEGINMIFDYNFGFICFSSESLDKCYSKSESLMMGGF